MIPILTDVERDIVDELERYDSLLMFHEVRTCFMGAIACPTDGINSMRMITSIWAGQLPTFMDVKDADQFFDLLINQLWDPFAEQQIGKKPFELTKWKYKATRRDLAALAEIRTDEIAIFIDAIEGPDDENVKLPRRAVQAVRVLGDPDCRAETSTPQHVTSPLLSQQEGIIDLFVGVVVGVSSIARYSAS